MAAYRIRSLVVDAEEYRPGDAAQARRLGLCAAEDGDRLALLPTDQGPDVIRPGDWVITHPDGFRVVRNPEAFAAIYEPAPELHP